MNFQKTILEGWNNSYSNGGYKWNSVHSLARRQPGKWVQVDFATMKDKMNQLIFILKYPYHEPLPLLMPKLPPLPPLKKFAFLSSQWIYCIENWILAHWYKILLYQVEIINLIVYMIKICVSFDRQFCADRRKITLAFQSHWRRNTVPRYMRRGSEFRKQVAMSSKQVLIPPCWIT